MKTGTIFVPAPVSVPGVLCWSFFFHIEYFWVTKISDDLDSRCWLFSGGEEGDDQTLDSFRKLFIKYIDCIK